MAPKSGVLLAKGNFHMPEQIVIRQTRVKDQGTKWYMTDKDQGTECYTYDRQKQVTRRCFHKGRDC